MPDCGDVVIEAFGCDPPPALVAAMAVRAERTQAAVWINLEYLSAEPFVERSHGLPSPQPGGLMKWFFYPGFTPRTGGLLRETGETGETGELEATAARAGGALLSRLGMAPVPGERVVSLFSYDNPALPALLQTLAAEPTLLLLTPGPAQRQVAAAPPGVRLARLPWLSQLDYDAVLAACDLNFVRGEDSLVRAIWAGKPFVWQAYPQHDGAHVAKLEALLGLWPAPADVAVLWRDWHGLDGAAWPGLPPLKPAWQQACAAWRGRLIQQPSLADQLLAFASEKALIGG